MVDGVIEPLGELVYSRRYASDLLDKSRVTYTVPWWGPYKAEPINKPPMVRGDYFYEEFALIDEIALAQLKLDLD